MNPAHRSCRPPSGEPNLELVTATWRGDLEPFRLMRDALSQSALRHLPHRIGVHSEDLTLFRPDATAGAEILPTADILAADLDQQRQTAIARQQRYGRTLTKWMTSTTRYGWPHWVRAIGWQMQQITKLTLVAQSQADLVIVIDSDVITSRQARVQDFVTPGAALTYHHAVASDTLSGKTAKWNRTAHTLFAEGHASTPSDDYFDTPFPMSPRLTRAMFNYLETRYAQPWWQVLMNQPPRRWSEFACYRAFLHHHVPAEQISWQAPQGVRYVYADSPDQHALAGQVEGALNDPACAFLTVHSQSSGKRHIEPAAAAAAIAPLIARHYRAVQTGD